MGAIERDGEGKFGREWLFILAQDFCSGVLRKSGSMFFRVCFLTVLWVGSVVCVPNETMPEVGRLAASAAVTPEANNGHDDPARQRNGLTHYPLAHTCSRRFHAFHAVLRNVLWE